MTARLPNETEAELHFQRCMALYVDWMGGRRTNGWNTRDSVCGDAMTNYMTADDDSDLVYAASDRKVGAAVQACMESLFNFEQNAVRIQYGLAKLWLYTQHDQAKSLDTGMSRLRQLVAQRC